MALGAALGALTAVAQGTDDSPFALRAHELPGRIVQVWPLAVSSCPARGGDLLVLRVEGGPPDQRRWVTWMPCGSATRPGDPAIVHRALAPEVVLVDVARTPGRQGAQLITVDASGLAIESLVRPRGESAPTGPERENQSRVEWRVPGGLPLPPRPRLVSRLGIVDDWHSTGRPAALVPALDGGRLIDLESGEARPLRMPVFADYRTWEPYLPAPVWKWMLADVTWPTLARADDDGDGRPDLFVLSRWEIWIYRTGPDGLGREPSRRIELVPFDEEAERRFEATHHSYFARDLDGDGRADLLLMTFAGGLMKGRSRAEVHLGDAEGVRIGTNAAAVREVSNGFASVHLADVNGDGRVELVETTLEFGALQLARILLTRRAEMVLRILALDPDAPDGTRTLFEDDIHFRLDFGSGRITGLVPGSGDWNGDGRLDLFESDGTTGIRIRIGSGRDGEPLFGPVVARQPVPISSGETRSVDLDGDGLDEIVVFDPTDPEVPLVVLVNRGRLPGTRPGLRAPPEEAPDTDR